MELDLFEAAAARRDAGMAKAEDHAGETWNELARAELEKWLRTHQRFFVDDFWRETALVKPPNAKALGPVILRAARAGFMHKVGYRPSIASNLSPKPEWASAIYLGPRA